MQREEVNLAKTTFKSVSIFSRKDTGPPLVLSSKVGQSRQKRVKQITGDPLQEGRFPKPLQHTRNLHRTPASDWLVFGNCFFFPVTTKKPKWKTNQLVKLANLGSLKLMWDLPASPQASRPRDDPAVSPAGFDLASFGFWPECLDLPHGLGSFQGRENWFVIWIRK